MLVFRVFLKKLKKALFLIKIFSFWLKKVNFDQKRLKK